jgi:hypothetical protein
MAGLTVIASAIPTIATAEVMDKEPTLANIWVFAVGLGVVGFLAWNRSTWLGIVASSLAFLMVHSFHWELTDPFVGPVHSARSGARVRDLGIYGVWRVCCPTGGRCHRAAAPPVDAKRGSRRYHMSGAGEQ